MDPAVPTWTGVVASAALIAVTVLVAWRQRLHLAGEVTVAAVRAAVQLIAVGAVLLVLFQHAGLPGAVGWLLLMVLIAAWTAARRTSGLPGAFRTSMLAIAAGTAATMGLLLVMGVIVTEARVVVPVGGMVVSGAMQATALVLVRLREEARTSRTAIETRLSLGLPSTAAFAPHIRTTLRTALIPAVDSTKTVGLISLPGAMTGLILAGVDPLTAIRYQIVVMYMLLAAATIAAIVAGRFAGRALFDETHRLRQV